MTRSNWEKSRAAARPRRERLKFLVGGVLLLGAIGYLIVSGTMAGAQYFISVEDMLTDPVTYGNQPVRITGAVIGDTINYDSENLIIEFTVVNMPTEFDDLALALHNAVNDPNAARLPVRVENQVKPDLLQHEAQAIMTGTLGDDGVFHVTELLLKCPSRFIEEGPEHVGAERDRVDAAEHPDQTVVIDQPEA